MENRIADLLERYRSEILPRKKQSKVEDYYCRKIISYPIGQETLETIEPETISKYRDEMVKLHGPRSAKYHLQILSHMTSLALAEWGVRRSFNPFKMVKKPSQGERSRRLSEREFQRFMEACQGELYMVEYVELAVATTMRGGELRRLRWPEVQWERSQASIIGKTGPRLVPLSKKAQEVLRKMHPFTGGHSSRKVFPYTDASFRKLWTKVVKKAGIVDFRPHDLRHEGISRYMERRDLTLQEVATISGHKTLTMLMRYTHLRASTLADRL